jgi:hypothetical protein
VVQGLGAAFMTPVGRTVMLKSVDKSELVSIMAITSIPMLVAPTLGPPLGGFITTYLDWPWVFLLNAPFGLVGIILILRNIPDAKEQVQTPFDGRGFLLTGTGLAFSLFGLDQLGAAPDWRWPALTLLAGIVLCLAAASHLRRKPNGLIPAGVFRHQTLRSNIIGGALFSRLPVRGVPFVLPLMFQSGMGMSAFRSGLLLMFLSGGDLLVKGAVAGLLKRFGFRNLMAASSFAMLICVMACSTFGRGVSFWLVAALLLMCGMARSVLFTSATSLTYADVPAEAVGPATVLSNMSQQVSSAIAISAAALAMHVSAAARHGGGLTLVDCRLALWVDAALGFCGTLAMLGLRADAGSSISGHSPSRRAE